MPRPRVHLWNLAEASSFLSLWYLLRVFSVCCFRFGACIFLWLQDWWVDQHGGCTWHVPRKLWHKAVRYTEWAQESLSGPIGVEDLLGPRPLCFLFALRCLLVVGLMLLVAALTLFRLFCLLVAAQDFEVTEEDVAWANQMRSRNVLFWMHLLFFSYFFFFGVVCFSIVFFGFDWFLRSLICQRTARGCCNRRQQLLERVFLFVCFFVCVCVRAFF